MCLLLVGVLHFVPDSDELAAALRCYRDLAVPGSHLVVSHATASAYPDELERITDLYSRTGTPLVLRDEEQVADLPGIVHGPVWRPDPGAAADEDPASSITLAGMAVRT